MPSLLRLLLRDKSERRKPRPIERDTIVLTLDDGRSIDILRVRDPRARRIKLSVDERGARLSLPLRASLISGERFVREHRDWLALQLDQHAHEDIAGLARGQTTRLPLRGAMLPVRWESGRYARVALDDAGQGLVFQASEGGSRPALRRALRDFYEGQARADIGRWLPAYLSGLPRAPSRIRFRAMSSQWGSLAPDDALSLDLALVLGRPPAFEYVLVHELCHLIRADHSPAFWREVQARCPDWRAERDYFRSEGRRLKASLHTLLSC